jgi:hypothetical protein
MPAEKQSGFPSGVLKMEGMDDCFTPAAKTMLDGIREKVYGWAPNPELHLIKVQSQAETLPPPANSSQWNISEVRRSGRFTDRLLGVG